MTRNKKMPRYHYSASPAALRATKSRQFEFSVTTENQASTQLENTFSLPKEYNIRQVRLVGLHYPYEAPARRVNDARCVTWGADSCATVPYTASHSFVGVHGDQAFAISAWLYLPALHATEVPIFAHGTEYYFSLTATLEPRLRVGSATDNVSRTSVEVVNAEEWVNVTACYAGTGLATDITLYINGTESEYVDGNEGAFVAMVNGAASSYIGSDDGVITFAGAGVLFSDLVLFNRVLSGYEAIYLYNSGSCRPIQPGNPIAVSRYTFGDAEGDVADTTLIDVLSGFDAAVTNTATLTGDAPAVIANVEAGDQRGTFLVSLANLPEVSGYTVSTASILGQTFSSTSTWAVPFEGLPGGGCFDYAPESDETAIAIEGTCLASSLQVRLAFVGADHDAQVSVLPRLQWGGAAKVVLLVSYYEA